MEPVLKISWTVIDCLRGGLLLGGDLKGRMESDDINESDATFGKNRSRLNGCLDFRR